MVACAAVLPLAGIVLYPVFAEVAVATYQNYIVLGEETARTRLTNSRGLKGLVT